MRRLRQLAALPLLLFLSFRTVHAEEGVDLDAMTRIRQEGYRRGQAKEILSDLCDGVGGRLTGSPSYKQANEWAQKKLKEIGLSNVHSEPFAFGRGWTYGRTAVTMRAPAVAVLPALPKAWTPGTDGPKRGKAVLAKLEKQEDLDSFHGKLEGKIVFLDDEPSLAPHDKADAKRYTPDSLQDLARWDTGQRYARPRPDRKKFLEERAFAEKRLKWLTDEKVLAVVSASRGDDGTIFVQQGSSAWDAAKPTGPTALAMAAEAYGRVYRLLKKDRDVELEIDVEAAFTPDDPEAAANVVGEIPGSDRKGEVVMLGGHLDSWHGGTGATDDGDGVAVAIEAARLLRSLGVAPKRTIRVALWAGEEQGLLGSRAYVAKHFATRPEPTDPEQKALPSWMRRESGPLTFLPEYRSLDAYFNVDNGGGKLRGVYAQENVAARPLFEAWLEPLKDLEATTVTMRLTGSTDHVSFDAVGLPGFQFIQDELDYMTRTHHSNMDVVERIPDQDLAQAAVVLASFVWDAANRPGMVPRKPLPPEPPAAPKTTAPAAVKTAPRP